MKPLEKPSPQLQEIYDKIQAEFTHEEMTSIVVTLASMSMTLADYTIEKNPMKLPTEVKYSVVQIGRFVHMLHHVVNNTKEKYVQPEIGGHIPFDWSYAQRYKYIVKAYYDALKESGEL